MMTNTLFNTRNKLHGFTITELMVAMLIASILMLGLVQIFVNTNRSTKTNDAFARLQDNVRYASEMIAREVRMGGYTGCRAGNLNNVLVNPTAWYNDTDNAVRGYEGDSSTSSFPSDFQADALVGSDALVILRGDTTDYHITQHNPNAAQFKISGTNDIVQGEILIVTDCVNSAVFQVSNSNSSNNTIVHNTGTINLSDGSSSNGNCYQKLGNPGTPKPGCSASAGNAHSYQGNGKIMKFIATAYYIGTSTSGETQSLYRIRVREGIVDPAEELVEGIENMQVLFGEDTDATPDGLANRYVSADDVSDFADVVSVRIGFLVHGIDKTSKFDDTQTYVVADTQIGPPSGGTTVKHAGDKRLRFSFNTTVKIRNKGMN